MVQIQKMLLDLMVEIDEVCRENDIQYFLDAGTALGAIRHDGFIPWDDDADIIMTEDNYNKFVKAVNSHTVETHRLVTDNRLNREHGTSFGRYVNLDTTKITRNTPFWDEKNANAGLIIDIFILFPLPKEEPARTDYMNLLVLYDEFQNRSFRHTSKRTDQFMRDYKKARADAEKKGHTAVLEEMESKLFNQNLSDDEFDEYIYLSSARMYPRTFPKCMFDEEPARLPFEGAMLPVSKYYLEEMRLFYGDDYYRLPDTSEHKIHARMHSPDIPFGYYVRDYMRFLDADEIKEQRRIYKEIADDEGFRRRVRDYALYEFVTDRVRSNLLERIEDEHIDLREELNNENWDLLTDVFEEWNRYQFSSVYKNYYEFIDLPDDVLYVALMTLIRRDGAYGKVYLYNQRYIEKVNRQLPPTLQDIQNLLDAVFSISSARFYGRTEDERKALEYAEAAYPDLREVRIERILLDVVSGKPADELLTRIDDLLTMYPNHPDLIKAKGDVLWNDGDKNGAMDIYDTVYEATNNGFIRLDIERKRKELAC